MKTAFIALSCTILVFASQPEAKRSPAEPEEPAAELQEPDIETAPGSSALQTQKKVKKTKKLNKFKKHKKIHKMKKVGGHAQANPPNAGQDACGSSNQVSDVEGNTYGVIELFSKCWLAENLRTTKYNDGTSIPSSTDTIIGSPNYNWYDNDIGNKNTYGALYNWHVVATGNLCPVGWHVPSGAEWQALVADLGGGSEAGGHLKESGTTHWNTPNEGAVDTHGFTALPGGMRNLQGEYTSMGGMGAWWSTTAESGPYFSKTLAVRNYTAVADYSKMNRNMGLSVRCKKD